MSSGNGTKWLFPTPLPRQESPPTPFSKGRVSLQMAAALNSQDKDYPVPIEHLVSYTDGLKVGYRHMLFIRGKNHLQENFLNYWTTIGIVSALVLGITLGAITGTPDPHKSLNPKIAKRIRKVFVSILLISSMFSTAAVMLSTVFFIRFSSCVGMEGIVEFLQKFPVNAPDYLNVVGSALFAIALCLLVYLLLPTPWSHVIGGSMASLLLLSTAAIIWMVHEGKTDRDAHATQYFEEINAAFFEGSY